ncbi:MAG: hypothetical protein Q7R31_04350 [Candidatus Levybacteria bacterium]|nr:hypothetical protein [Candidatus Levybacteria bacterium]
MSNFSTSRTIIFAVFAIALLIVAFVLVFNKKGIQVTSQLLSPISQVSPTVVNVTSQNADKVVEDTDKAIQESTSQLDSDLNSLDNIDQTQDSTAGL